MLLTFVQCSPASTDVLIWPLVLAVQIAPRFAVDMTKSTMDAPPPPRPPPGAGAAGAPGAVLATAPGFGAGGGGGGGAPHASGFSVFGMVRSGLAAFHD